METLYKLQNDRRLTIEKARTNLKKAPKDRICKSYIETRIEVLDTIWQSFLSTHNDIVQAFLEIHKRDKYFTDETYDVTEELYIIYKSELKEILVNLGAKSETNVKSMSKDNVELPKINIPIFSGHYAEWPTFKDLFLSLINNNEKLDDVQRLHYLKGLLSGEAEQLVRHIPITSSNYVECWSRLKGRYDNKRFLSNCLLKRLMTQKSAKETSHSIKDLLNTTMECINGLKNLGVDVSTWDIIVVYIVSAKLDTESRSLWETSISSSDELPRLSQLREFLEARFRALEFLEPDPIKVKSNLVHNKTKVMHTTTSGLKTKSSCSYCQGDHKISNCKEFVAVDYRTRHSFAQTNGLCFNCLGRNHSANTCRSFTKCRICKHKHHSLLHPKPTSEIQNVVLAKPDLKTEINSAETNITTLLERPDSNSRVTAHFSKQIAPKQILLATALVETEARNGHTHLLRALLDQGSQASFVTESAVQLLGLRKIANKSYISGLGGDKSPLASRYIVVMKIQSRHDPGFHINVHAHVLGTITSLLPSKKVASLDWPELAKITLADPQYYNPSKIDILMGADVYGQVIREGLIKGPNGRPTAQCTALGWILSGPTHQSDDDHLPSSNCYHNIITSMFSHVDDNELLKRFWQIESESLNSKFITPEEQRCEEFYSQTTQRDSSGRYIVRLPFRDENPQCIYGNSKNIALKRFHLLENRLKKNPELKARYSEVMREYLDLGHIERIPDSELNKVQSVYLPHHAVIRDDKTTTKIRVVFDASCKGTNGVSLNDTLMVGPTLQQDLRHIIIRWRMHPICLSADIIKMYRQVIVAEHDVDFQRLVWRNDPESEIKEYRLVRVTFGTAAAPYLAVKTLQQLAIDEGEEFPDVAEKVKTDFYVDDLLTGCQSVEEGKRIHDNMKKLLSKGGFVLQKWITNEKNLAKVVMDGNGIKEGKVEIRMDKLVKILGISWNKDTDAFHYTVQLPVLHNPITKRKVVSSISRLFDPLGWVAPCIIVAKVMIQKLWLAGIDWDDELPDELLKEWVSYQDELIYIHDLSIPRWLQARTNDAVIELQGFCDASKIAYAAVVYLRTVDAAGNVCANLITAKTKVAPTMQVSIPRLELMAAVLLAKLINDVANNLGIDHKNIHGWTDSTVVLAWLSNHPSRWTTFVGNRTSEILSNLDNTQWAHVQSAQNPADIASRGCTPLELANNCLWLQGPPWLKDQRITYPRPKSISTTVEERKIKSHVSVKTDTATDSYLWTKFSSLQKLIRVVAYCRRFLRKKGDHKLGPFLTSDELTKSLNVCLVQCQHAELRESKQKLQPLSPFLDDKGIMRVGGRIQAANLPIDTKHPIILPHKSHLTNLIIDDAHRKTLHGGPTLMLNYLRTKYWIISAKGLVKTHVRKCVVCVRNSAIIKNQFMGQLPSSRVTPNRPFLHSGVDFAGPINIRMTKGRGNKSHKGYICLFVCMSTKAIHLEVISDLTSDGFISGFKRFVARRGHVSNIWSDNGTNFVGASKELYKYVIAEQSSVAREIQEWLSNNSVTWHFIPAHAPNFGGLWEAGVKATKYHLKRVIGVSTLTYEELSTVLVQIEACLNSRPLSMLPDNHTDPAPLTPGHFLVGEPLIIVPDRNYERSNISTLRRWQLTQRMVQDFWRRWSNEYLVNCLQRYKWSKITPEPNIGDVVLVKEENLPPARWLLGRVVEKHPGPDRVTRVVTLRCGQSLLKRPTSKLCILPVTN